MMHHSPWKSTVRRRDAGGSATRNDCRVLLSHAVWANMRQTGQVKDIRLEYRQGAHRSHVDITSVPSVEGPAMFFSMCVDDTSKHIHNSCLLGRTPNRQTFRVPVILDLGLSLSKRKDKMRLSIATLVTLGILLFQVAAQTCHPSSPCKEGCCNKFGNCGFGPDCESPRSLELELLPTFSSRQSLRG